jgi:hypothetical protein
MAVDLLFADRPPEKRKRKPCLIGTLDPEIRRRFKQIVNRFPAELKRQLLEDADKQGLSPFDVAFQRITLYYLRLPRPVLPENFHDPSPIAPAGEIQRGLNSLQVSLDAKMRHNRKSTG